MEDKYITGNQGDTGIQKDMGNQNYIEVDKLYSLAKFLEVLKLNGIMISRPTLALKVKNQVIYCQDVKKLGKRVYPLYSGKYINTVLSCLKETKLLDWDKVKKVTEEFRPKP